MMQHRRGTNIMPYRSIGELPLRVNAHLPVHAREIYLAAFNNAWDEYEDRGAEQREKTAHRVAWAAVKRMYQKSGDRWIRRQST
jgi:cation transport regulator